MVCVIAEVNIPESVDVTQDAQSCLDVHVSWFASVAREFSRRVG